MSGNLTLIFLVMAGLVVVLFAVGFAMLFRNRRGAQPSSAAGLPALRNRANGLLVQLDETLASADNELGFAIAQFGEKSTADFAADLSRARTMATAAFRLRKELDDAFPESVTKQRELTLQITALCEAAQSILDKQQDAFTTLRSRELAAPVSLAALRSSIDTARARIEPAQNTVARLAASYRPDIATEHERAISRARQQLDDAATTVAAAAAELKPSGVNAVSPALARASSEVGAAIALLDSIDLVAAQLDKAAAAAAEVRASSAADIAEARKERDAAPDAETGDAIIDAIDGLEKAVGGAAPKGPRDPLDDLDALNAAVAALDSALASARNQTQRLAHAKLALEGTLVSATSQIAAVRGFITAGGSGVGAQARSRLSEAERELVIAKAEADPVDALDAARRAVTNARDADALARYDALDG